MDTFVKPQEEHFEVLQWVVNHAGRKIKDKEENCLQHNRNSSINTNIAYNSSSCALRANVPREWMQSIYKQCWSNWCNSTTENVERGFLPSISEGSNPINPKASSHFDNPRISYKLKFRDWMALNCNDQKPFSSWQLSSEHWLLQQKPFQVIDN